MSQNNQSINTTIVPTQPRSQRMSCLNTNSISKQLVSNTTSVSTQPVSQHNRYHDTTIVPTQPVSHHNLYLKTTQRFNTISDPTQQVSQHHQRHNTASVTTQSVSHYVQCHNTTVSQQNQSLETKVSQHSHCPNTTSISTQPVYQHNQHPRTTSVSIQPVSQHNWCLNSKCLSTTSVSAQQRLGITDLSTSVPKHLCPSAKMYQQKCVRTQLCLNTTLSRMKEVPAQQSHHKCPITTVSQHNSSDIFMSPLRSVDFGNTCSFKHSQRN